jgi:hypothetical protein
VLSDASGQQLLNTLRPFGEALPKHADPDRLRHALQTARPVISDLYNGGVARAPLIAVEVPVFSAGAPAFSRSAHSGWTIAIGVPQEGLISRLRQSLLFNLAAVVFLLALAALLAAAIGGHIAPCPSSTGSR